MPSPSVTPKPKVPIAQASNTASSSWPHPSNVLEAAVAVRPASFIGAKAKHPLQPTAEQVSPKHQFAPLAPLSTISEIPKMELLESDFAPEPPASIGSSQQTGRSDQEESTKAVEPSKSGSMNEEQAERHRAQGFARPSNVLSFGPPAEAASIPLPQSPTPNNEKDSTDGGPSLSPEHASKGPQELDPGLGESNAEATDPPNKQDREEKGILASILPQFMANQLPRQDTGMASTRTARSTSVAPGAYPESDSMEDTPIPTPDPNSVATQAEAGQSETSPSQADSKSIRSRKSVSIVLPEQHREPEDQQETDADTSKSREGARADLAALKTQEDDDRSVEAKQSPRNDWPAGSNQQREANQEEGRNENAVAERKGPQEVKQDPGALEPHADKDQFLRPSNTSGGRDGSSISPTSSVATSQKETDRADTSTLHERESLAPSDADNSSMLPLLSSSARDARSSHFSESWDENDHAATGTKASRKAGINQRAGTDSPPIVDDFSSLSTISSLAGSEAEKPDKKKRLEYPFPPVDNGEGPSRAASSLPAPKIVVKDASEGEDSLQSPQLRAPTTTPVQEGSSPRRQATFAALGEPFEHQGPVKLPMKRRKLYVRKARYAVLRQPVLNAALGRQVGSQAKSALKKLANGELIVIEPPTSL